MTGDLYLGYRNDDANTHLRRMNRSESRGCPLTVKMRSSRTETQFRCCILLHGGGSESP